MLGRYTLMRTVRTLLLAVAVVVSLLPLQAQDYTATVLEQTGQVSVRSGGYDKPLFMGGAVRPQEMIVTGPDGFARFRVSDGSTFEVYSNSRLIFREHLANWKDLLNIVLGRVKVYIQHAPGIPNHNEVSSPTAVISVRGTVFDVVVQDDEGTTVVSVDEGLVSVRNFRAGGDAVVRPGETLTVYPSVPLFAKQVDKSGVYRAALKAVRDAVWQVLLGRQGSSTGPLGGGGTPTGTAQGDHPKPGSPTTTPGTPTGTPGTSPGTPPGAPPGGGG